MEKSEAEAAATSGIYEVFKTLALEENSNILSFDVRSREAQPTTKTA